MDLQELSDRAEIADLMARYAQAVDTRSWEHLDDIFTADAVIDYTAMGGPAGGPADIKAYLAETMPMFSVTQHLLGLPAIEVDGDRAGAVFSCHNPMVVGSGPAARTVVCSLWYHEKLIRTGRGWRICELVEQRGHMTFLPVAPTTAGPPDQ